ncbi:cobalamin-dependent protein [Dehalobacter sp. DCM]|uniref:cobalamin B12-binding domain-containing protein n=1 Tax=Dehalobacter sp. DCM TaxID=2907827 RepID=UPI0030814720|nr:cobalamin-dependent protein [Dehalobacter sp. DCM]
MLQLTEITKAVGQLDEEKLNQLLESFVSGGPTEEEAQVVVNACQQGMAIVGELFESGEYFVGDLIFAGELLTQSMEMLKPVIGRGKSVKVGKIVLGTVEGDLHDIGKNIFRSMAEAAGFEVYDLGIDQKPSAYVDKIKEVRPDVIGMSGVLTLALESMRKTVDEICKAGMRDKVKIIIGGNPVTAEACMQIGADAFTTNAADGVKICQAWVK